MIKRADRRLTPEDEACIARGELPPPRRDSYSQETPPTEPDPMTGLLACDDESPTTWQPHYHAIERDRA